MNVSQSKSLYIVFSVALSFSATLFAAGPKYVPGELIVKLKNTGGSSGSSKAFSRIPSAKAMDVVGTWRSLNMHKLRGKPNTDMEKLAKEIASDPEVEYAEPNYIYDKASIESTFSDVVSLSEFQAQSVGSFSLTSANIDAQNAWTEMSTEGSKTIVAVIDTGIDFNHNTFNKLCGVYTNTVELNGVAGVDDDRNGYIDDVHGWNFAYNNNNPQDDDGHGTHVSGIVLGTTIDILNLPTDSNDECVGDYESPIEIMPLKFLDNNGSGSTSDAIEAIYYAINNGAKVLNNSWGGGTYSRALHEAIVASYNRNIVFVAAAGNAGEDNDSSPMFPASYDVPNVISVAATSSSDYKASFSNFGLASVHMGSPGVSIYSTIPGNYYATMSGTSMAAPFVSGIASLILREKSGMNPYQVRNIISSEGDSVSGLSSYTITGNRVNVSSSVTYAKSASIDSYKPVYSINMSIYDRDVASALASGGAGCGLVSKLTKGGPKGPGSGSGGGAGFLMFLIAVMAPLGIWLKLKSKSADYKREFERYSVDSKVKLKVGDKEIEGSMESISMGGAGINVDHLLDHGSVVKLMIVSPDGNSEIEVDGHIVWTDGGQQHGVRFVSVADRVKESLQNFTSLLGGSKA